MVAKPVPRNLWKDNARAQAAVDAEWDKLRKADDGKGTWDESVVREYWDIQKEAKQQVEEIGNHTHTSVLSLTCA